MKTNIVRAPAVLLLAAATAHAQVTTDGTVGARVTLSGRNIGIADTLGLRAGVNLLHSFSTFNIGAGERATFTGVGFIQNIIARITGGPSRIDGTVASAIPASNLYLVNPSGIVFGPTAAIDVPGSFHASTANYIRLEDGTRILTTATNDVTLTFASPAAFGFQGPGAPITLSGAQLLAREGQRISLSAGAIALEAFGSRPALLSTASGSIGLLATQSAGEAWIDPRGLRGEGFGAMGDVRVSGSAVSVLEGPGRRGAGAISIDGGNVTLDHATLDARTTFAAGSGIDILAAGSLDILASNVLSTTRGAGDAGALTLRARDITIAGGSLVDTSCDPGCSSGAGGTLTVVATGNLTLRGDDANLPTYLVSNSFGGGRTGAIDIRAGALVARGNAYIQGIARASGDGTSITIASDSITLIDGAQVDVTTRGSGQGGTLRVANTGNIRIEGTQRETNADITPSGFFSNAESSGRAGAIVVSTRDLQVLRGGEISSSSRRGATGAGGRVAINASGLLRVSGVDAQGKPSGIVSNAFSSANAGDVELVADVIEVSEGALIQVQSEGAGRAGNLRVAARTLTIASQGQLSSDARGTGDGGSIEVAVAERLAITGDDTGIFAKTFGSARGGSVRVEAGDIDITNGGGVFAGTDGSGNGGDVRVAAAQDITVSGGGSISAESRATGLAGSIDVSAGDTLVLAGNGRITTSARLADGGDVRIAAGRFGFVENARITTEVGTGQGSGGNIDIRIPTLVLSSGVITANAFGGDGGNIRIGTTTFVPSASSKVTASSALGIDGTITLESPALDPTGELLVPGVQYFDAASVLAGRCGARFAGRASSLLVEPRRFSDAAPDALRSMLELLSPSADGACCPVPPVRS